MLLDPQGGQEDMLGIALSNEFYPTNFKVLAMGLYPTTHTSQSGTQPHTHHSLIRNHSYITVLYSTTHTSWSHTQTLTHHSLIPNHSYIYPYPATYTSQLHR